MQQLRWCISLLFTSWTICTCAVRFESAGSRAKESEASTSEVRATVLARGQKQGFAVPLPPGFQYNGQFSRALARATSLNPEVASASATATVDHRRLMLRNGPAAGLVQCEVTSTCHAAGTAYFRLDISLPSLRQAVPPVLLAKSCSADVLRGLNVGQKPHGSDVVRHGQSFWTRHREPEFSNSVNEVNLHISMDSSDAGQQFAFPVVRTTVVKRGLPGMSQRSPQAWDLPNSIAQVEVLSDLDKGDLSARSPKFTRLFFKCHRAGTIRVELLLNPRLPWEPYAPVSMWLTKSCGGGPKKGFDVGSSAGLKDLVADGSVLKQNWVVGNLVDMSSFYVKYASAGRAEPDQKPDAMMRCVDTRGGMPTSALTTSFSMVKNATSDGSSRYDVSYSCLERAEFECTLRFGLKLSRSPQLKWRKHCGGAARPDIIVDSSLARYAAVFASGQPASAWNVDAPQVSLPAEEDDVSFTVRRRIDVEGSKPAALGAARVRSSDSSVLEASLTNAASIAGRVLAGDKDGASLLVHHNCKSRGKATVTVFIATENMPAEQTEASSLDPELFGPISFSYIKSCGGAGPGFLQLAGGSSGVFESVTLSACVIPAAVILLIVMCMWSSGSKQDRHETRLAGANDDDC